MLSSNTQIKVSYTKYVCLIENKTNYTKPKFRAKFVHILQLHSKFLIDVIFCLKISSNWDSLISIGSVCYNFVFNTPDGAYAIRNCVSFRQGRLLFSLKLYGTSFLSNTCVIEVGCKLFTVL